MNAPVLFVAYLVFVALHDNRVSGPLNFMPDFQCLNARIVDFQTEQCNNGAIPDRLKEINESIRYASDLCEWQEWWIRLSYTQRSKLNEILISGGKASVNRINIRRNFLVAMFGNKCETGKEEFTQPMITEICFYCVPLFVRSQKQSEPHVTKI